MIVDIEKNVYETYISEILFIVRRIIEKDMQSTCPLFLNIKENFIEKIVSKIINNRSERLIIGITGESACGKTTFVNAVVNTLYKYMMQKFFTQISCDDYYFDTSKELIKAGSYEELFKTGFSFDTPEVINLELLKNHLINLKAGKSVKVPKYDFVTCVSRLDSTLKNPSKIIITEGLFVLNKKLSDILDIKVYVHTPYDVIKKRWYDRAKSRGKTGEACNLQFKNVSDAAKKHIHPTYQHADIVLSGLVKEDYIIYIVEKFISAFININYNI